MHSREKFNDYSLSDFVWNKQCRDWILSRGDDSNAFWNNWLIEHPGKRMLINAAKEVILCLDIKEPLLSEESIDKVVQDTLNQVEGKEIEQQHKKGLRTISQNFIEN